MRKYVEKTAVLLSCMFIFIFLSGCAGRNASDETLRTVRYDYDMDAAVAMVDEIEWLCTWLQMQDTVSRDTVERLAGRLQELQVVHDYIQPTIYYEGVAVVSATEERLCETEEREEICGQRLFYSKLVIRKEYTGDDERLQDWFLEYVFTQQERGGEWRFETYNGTYNLEVGLPVKAEFYETDYRAD